MDPTHSLAITTYEKIKWKLFIFFINFYYKFLKNKLIDWGNNKLQSGLSIINKKPEAILNNLLDALGQPYLSVTLNLWSIIPIKLYPVKVIGRVETKNFEEYLYWDKIGSEIYRHIIGDIELKENSWRFIIQPPLEILKNSDCLHANWYFCFTVEFEGEISKTFNDIIFKIRKSDIERARAHFTFKR